MSLTLQLPSQDFIHSYIEAMAEGFSPGSGPPPEAEELKSAQAEPETYFHTLTAPKPRLKQMPDGRWIERVPQTTFWLLDEPDFIGAIMIRHHLTPELEKMSGNIGYAIRPSRRRQGYGSKMLALALPFCREQLKLERVLLSCDDQNVASWKVIEANNGQLIDRTSHPYESSQTIRRYWVPTGMSL